MNPVRASTSNLLLRGAGRTALGTLAELGGVALFTARALAGRRGGRGIVERWIRAIHEQGVRCLPVVLIVGAFTGLVLGLQCHHILSRFGSESALGALVALTLARELAPVLAALMIVGQAGSALSAELGFQRNSEQIDALASMGIDPIGFLVAPRVLAGFVAFPIHAVLFTLVGIGGGFLSGSVLLGLDEGLYWLSVREALRPADVFACLLKALVFGVLAVAICAHSGCTTRRRDDTAGVRAVSAATTRGVVRASIAILAADYVVTAFLV